MSLLVITLLDLIATHLKIFIAFYILVTTASSFAQNNQSQADSGLWLNINLHHQIPSFQYFNEKIENGIFTEQIKYERQSYTIQGGFKEYKSDGLWVALDTNQTPRLLALFRSDTLIFLHLNDSLGRPAHHFTYRGLEKLNEEWYNDGKLIQYNDYAKSGCIITSYHQSLKPRMTLFIDKNGVAYKKVMYDKDGNFIKETYDVNE
ncbi:MAG: hypothetical protein MK105_18255 [Crocinitomicaceae bacterium]|nr:hypothetical protein [Crocinitomicaceae bacterium]